VAGLELDLPNPEA